MTTTWRTRLRSTWAEAHARALLGDREGTEELIGRAHDILRDVDMAMLVDWALRVEAAARTALGDAAEARAILGRLDADAEHRGLARLAAAYRRELAALDSASAD